MPSNRTTFRLPFPVKGLVRDRSYAEQDPLSTVGCLNIWPIDAPTGRYRGGTRPPLDSLASIGGSAVYNWCRLSYGDSNTIKIGVAITTSGGTFESLNGATWTERVSQDIATQTFPNQASCACYNGVLFQAASTVAQIRCKILPSGDECDLSGVLLSNGHPADISGTPPTNCGIVIAHADRLWAMADRDAPHVVYASAVGQYYNWDATDTTIGGAFVNTGAEGGLPGEPIVAAISHGGVLHYGGPTSVYTVRGNPKVAGVRQTGFHIGPLSNRSWCAAPDGYIYMVTPTGVHRMPQTGGQPEPISEQIPNELKGLNCYDGDVVSIGYDHRWRMLHVYVDPASGSNVAYVYKLPEGDMPGSWWPIELSPTIHLAATFPELISSNTSSLLPIGSNATAYQYNRSDPDTEAFDSWLMLSFPLGTPTTDGILHSVTGVLADNSDPVNWEVFVGESAEAAYVASDVANDFADKDVAFAGSKWGNSNMHGLQYRQHPKVRGNSAIIRIYDQSNEEWLLESIECEVQGGLRRYVQSEAINE